MERGFIRLNHHLVSSYVSAAMRNGFVLTGCEEPLLSAPAARTPTAGRIADAAEQAFAGLPAVVVLDFERT